MKARALRIVLVWAGTTAFTALSAGWAASGVELDARLDLVLVDLATVALALCAGWAWVVTSAVLVQALGSGAGTAAAGPPRPLRGVPTWAARAILVACGLAVLTTTPGQASDGAHGPAPAAPPSLDGLPLPDRPSGPARPPTLPAGRAERPEPTPVTRPVVVRPGDTLWSIARSRMDPGADDAAVARATAALHAANRDAIGPDPDLIHPGLHLRAPERRPDH